MSGVRRIPAVPAFPRRVLETALTARHRQHWLGDLAEEFHRHRVPEQGLLRARVWYWRQAFGSLGPALLRRFGGGSKLPPHGGRQESTSRSGLFDALRMDLRSAVRGLRARPAFTSVAVATLALGIGVNVAIFSVVNATILRPLPYDRPEELIRFWPDQLFTNSLGGYVHLLGEAPTEMELGAYGRSGLTFTGGSEPEQVRGAVVSADHFDLLGVRPALGRGFVEGEGEPGRDRVVVISDALWQRRFGSDPEIVGSMVEVSGQPWEVIGVLPASHQPLEHDWQIWIPLDMEPQRDRGNALATIARLKPGFSHDQATAFFRESLARYTVQRGGEVDPDTQAAMSVGSLREWLLGEWQTPLLLLLGAVGLVLFIACANVGNLMLARTTARLDELGLRAALGAGRWRVVRLLLVESLLLAALGALVGVSCAWALVGSIRSSVPLTVPRLAQVAVNGSVLGYAVLVAIIAAIGFGLLPALRGALRARIPVGGGRSSETADESWIGRALVAGQVTVSVILVIGAGLLVRSLWTLQSVDPGFRAGGLVVLRPGPPGNRYPDEADVRAYHAEVQAALRALPGVSDVGGIMFLPMRSGGWWSQYTVNDRADGSTITARVAGRVVTDAYFSAMQVPLLEGRVFAPADEGGQPVVIVNAALAREGWPGESAVGKVLATSDGETRTIVGVVGNVRQQELAVPSNPEMYQPYSQVFWRSMYFAARVDGDAADYVAQVRDAVRSIDPAVPVTNLSSMQDVVAETTAESQFLAMFVAAFGAVALVLGMIGVYGVTAYAVARRRHEIGIRMAIGAPRGAVLGQTLQHGALPVALGLAIGMLVAAGASGLLRGMLFEVEPLDPATFVAVPLILALTAFAALWFPSRRATLVDPVSILRD